MTDSSEPPKPRLPNDPRRVRRPGVSLERPQDPPLREPIRTERPAPENGRSTMPERLLGMTRTMTITNVLILALIALVAIPTYAGYRFLTDEEFRREFLVKGELIDAKVPCVVLRASGPGRVTRYTIGSAYAIDQQRRLDRIVAVRSAGNLSDAEIAAACQDVVAAANRLKEGKP